MVCDVFPVFAFVYLPWGFSPSFLVLVFYVAFLCLCLECISFVSYCICSVCDLQCIYSVCDLQCCDLQCICSVQTRQTGVRVLCSYT